MSSVPYFSPFSPPATGYAGMQMPSYGQMPMAMPMTQSPYAQNAFGMQSQQGYFPNLPIAAMGQIPPMTPPQAISQQPPGFFSNMGQKIGGFMQQGVQYAQNHPMVTTGAAMGLAGGMMGCPYSACMGLGSVATGLAQSQWNPWQ